MMNYVPLDRRFDDLPGSESELEKQDAFAWFRRSYGHRDWPNLLEQRFVVVLGEAGTGKTTELRQQASALRVAGEAAVFIRLDSLVDGDLDAAVDDELDSGNIEAYRAWRRTSRDVTFFLDSVDEAKLAGPGKFNRALASFVNGVADAGVVVRVVLSCRPNDWQFRTDLQRVKSALASLLQSSVRGSVDASPSSSPTDAANPAAVTAVAVSEQQPATADVVVVTLCPLDRQQLAVLAAAMAVPDVPGLLAEIDRTGADFLVQRPMDVEWVAAHWSQYRRLGTLSEMMETGLTAKLADRNDARTRADPLTPGRARSGAERLAAATVLCRQPMIRIPDPALASNTEPAIDAAAVLPDWTHSEIQFLLGRALFDEAVAGRVRFHHRTAAAYLAAQWLLRLVRECDCPVAAARGLLVGEAFGATWPIADRKELAGWVASGNADLRRALNAVVPEVVLAFGDAEQVPIPERAQALQALVARHADGHRFDLRVDDAEIRRLADPALAMTVLECLAQPGLADDVVRFLLRVGAEGATAEVTAAALAIATDPLRSDGVRSAGVRAVGAAGTDAQRRALKDWALDATGQDAALIAIADSLFPAFMSVNELMALVDQLSDLSINDTTGAAFQFANYWAERCPEHHRLELLRQVQHKVTEPPHHEGDPGARGVSRRFGGLARVLSRCVEVVLAETAPLDDATVATLVDAILVVHAADSTSEVPPSGFDSLKGSVAETPAVHRAVLRQFVVSSHADPKAPPRYLFGSQAPLNLLPGDQEWLAAEAGIEADLTARYALLRAAISLWWHHGQVDEARDQLLASVERANLPDEFETALLDDLRRASAPDPPVWRQRQAARDRTEGAIVERNREKLGVRLDEMRHGRDYSGLQFLVGEMARLPGHTSSRWAQSDFTAVEERYGADIVAALKAGLRIIWRQFTPLLPCERPDPNKMENGVSVGLTGLTHLSADEWAALDGAGIRVATHYALNEMNGFPEWFPALAGRCPDPVGPIVFQETRAEFGRADQEHGSSLFRAIARHKEVAVCVAGALLDHLEKHSPTVGATALADALAILDSAGTVEPQRLTDLAERETKSRWEDDVWRALAWWTVWFRRQAVSAWDFLEPRIDSASVPAQAIVFSVLTHIAADAERQVADAHPLDPDLLVRMLPVLHRHRPEGSGMSAGFFMDSWQLDGAFGSLARLLELDPSAAAHRALVTLSQHPDLVNLRAGFATAVHRHAERVVAGLALEPSQVAEFSREFETDPRTPNELHNLVLNRLRQLKYEMEDGDFSVKGLFRPGDPESNYQKYTNSRLAASPRLKGSVARESQVANDKRLDIRVSNLAGKTTIEIKPLDTVSATYSFAELKATIEDQLVGRYMRDHESRHGILLLYLGEYKQFAVDGLLVEFAELVEALQRHAREVEASRPGVDRLDVIGVDCTPWKAPKAERTGRKPK